MAKDPATINPQSAMVNGFRRLNVITHSHFLGRRFCVITPNFRARFLRLQTRVSRIVWKGFAPLSLAVSTVVRTSASAWAAHMAR